MSYSAYNPNLPDPTHDGVFFDGVTAKRLIAWVFDVIVTLVLSVMLSIATIGIGFLLFPLVWLGVGFVYRTLSIASGSATWGMRMTGIELRDRSGHRLTGGQAMIHTLIYSISMGTVVLQFVSAVLMLTTRYKQGMPDIFLGTTAINRPL